MTQLTLIALAHAGGSAKALYPFRHHLPASIELRPLDLPGRGSRFKEPLVAARKPLIEQLAAELAPSLHTPYALFGHSLGGMLAFELAHALLRRGLPAARALCIAAAPAPCSQKRRRPPETWSSDAALMSSLRKLGGTPPELFEHAELLDLFLPIVRADFQLCDDVPEQPLGALPCPIHVYAGRGDSVEQAALQSWQRVAGRGHTLTFFDGDHFFVRTHTRELCSLLAEQLLPLASEPSRALSSALGA